MREFVNALLSTEDDLLTCEQCQEEFADYSYAVANDKEISEAFIEVGRHIGWCPSCSQAYVEYVELVEQGYTDPTAHVNTSGWDASFLNTPPAQAASSTAKLSSFWDTAQAVYIRIDEAIANAWANPTLSAAGLKSIENNYTLCELTTEDLRDMSVKIDAEPLAKNPNLCQIISEIDIPSLHGWPNLAGVEVNLSDINGNQLAKRQTDAYGQVIFDDIPVAILSTLIFAIEPSTRKPYS